VEPCRSVIYVMCTVLGDERPANTYYRNISEYRCANVLTELFSLLVSFSCSSTNIFKTFLITVSTLPNSRASSPCLTVNLHHPVLQSILITLPRSRASSPCLTVELHHPVLQSIFITLPHSRASSPSLTVNFN
jgi:hypothetical protein